MNEEQALSFSVVVVAKNAEETICETVISALEQEGVSLEVMVKDGGSTDQTLARLPMDPRIRLLIGSDSGVYDAMNQAIRAARGRWLCFLNCGDRFCETDVLRQMTAFLDDATVVYGDYSRGGVYFRQPDYLTRFALYRSPLCHQTMVFPAAVLRRFGGYDSRLRILADWQYTLLLRQQQVGFRHIPVRVCDYRGGGLSETPEGRRQKKRERKVLLRLFYTRAERLLFGAGWRLSLPRLRAVFVSDRAPGCVRRCYRATVNRFH